MPPDSAHPPRRLLWTMVFWPLPGAVCGAALAFHVYFRQPGLNNDTAGPMIVGAVVALAGLVAGTLLSSAFGWAVDTWLRRQWPDHSSQTSIATLFILAVLFVGLEGLLESRLPALLWPRAAPATVVVPDRTPPELTCGAVAPTEPALRKAWELECR